MKQDTSPVEQHALPGFWAEFGPDVRQTLRRRLVVRAAKSGDVIYRRGEPPDGLYAIGSGRVRFTRSNSAGTEQLLTTLSPGDIFGEYSALSGQPRAHDATCDSDARLLLLPLADLNELAVAHAAFSLALAKRMAQHGCEMFDLLEDLMLHKLEPRLARRLVMLAQDHTPTGPRAIVTQEDLAKLSGATRQSVGACLKNWHRLGWIRQSYRHIDIVDARALRQLADAH